MNQLKELWRGLSVGWTPALVAVALVAIALGAALGAPLGDRVYAYQWSDARFCDDCHAHDYANEAWSRSAHADLTTCHDCHRVPIRHYPRNLWVTITHPPQTPEDIPHPEVPVVICETCHTSEGCDPHELSGPMSPRLCAQVVDIDGTAAHRVHLAAEHRDGPIGCLDCHGTTGTDVHRFSASDLACARCHEGHEREAAGRTMACRQCHGGSFLRESPAAP